VPTDNDKKGLCTTHQVRSADFSKPGPPTFSMVRIRVCVSTPSKYSLAAFAQVAAVVFVVFGLVLYKFLRRRTLADYGR